MTYAISDVHGCYDKYINMLKLINFSEKDILYVVGDVIDRGTQGIKILQDMSMRGNVYPIMVNHEYIALSMLKILMVEITADNFNKHLDEHILDGLKSWLVMDGGQVTLDEFSKLSQDEKEAVIEYLEEFSPYEIAFCNKKRFILTHAGVPDGATLNNLNDFNTAEFVTAETDYSKNYFEKFILITGHTPTFTINENYKGKIYKKNNNIAIDCGVVYGESLGCICLESGQEFYVLQHYK